MSVERSHYNHNNCFLPVQPSMTVCQLVGQGQKQESLDIRMHVPRGKPSIEQVVDVYVRRVKITSINIVYNKVIVRGKYEIKVLYVACKPSQPVHALEMHNVRFTAAVDILGACPGMEAEATVRPEFVDYDCDRNTRAGWYKQQAKWNYEEDCGCEKEYDEECDEEWDECEEEEDDCCCEDECDSCHHPKPNKHKKPCKLPNHCKPAKPCNHDHHCKPDCDCKMPKKCARRCHVSVVLQVIAKVFTFRDILIQTGGLPVKPKG